MGKSKDYDKGFMNGYACAISTLVRCFDEGRMAVTIIEEGGFSVDDFTEVEESDFELIKNLFIEERGIESTKKHISESDNE